MHRQSKEISFKEWQDKFNQLKVKRYEYTTLEFYRGDKTFFDGNVFVCEEYIKIHTIPQYQASVRGKIINATHQFRKSDIERHISDWLN